MRATEFSELQAFGLVAKYKSFVGAADQLGISRSAVTQIIQSLERRLGMRLLNRTTRSVSPTQAGQELLARLEPALAALGSAVSDMEQFRDIPAGVVRIAASPLGAKLHLEPIIAGFREAYSDVVLDITIDNAEYHDCVSEGFDAVVGLGCHIDKDMVALELGGPLHLRVVASPAYIALHGMPATPQDLQNHNCIGLRKTGQAESLSWPFVSDGQPFSVPINKPMMVNDELFALDAAVKGAGILLCAKEMSEHLIRDGQLCSLLESWCVDWPGFYLYYPKHQHTPVAFRVFKDYIRNAENTHAIENKSVADMRRYRSR
ncbi:MAG: LysR family transcriptional regulator [Verrucomicrobiaceae bacterium]|nr:LysR family transcriptional regulator [Verrucomicrobiaceae bacterium]